MVAKFNQLFAHHTAYHVERYRLLPCGIFSLYGLASRVTGKSGSVLNPTALALHFKTPLTDHDAVCHDWSAHVRSYMAHMRPGSPVGQANWRDFDVGAEILRIAPGISEVSGFFFR
jgi:hypothetical protein